MKRSLLLLLAVNAAFAAKRPVTLDDIGKKPAGLAVSPVWSADDKRFAYIEDEKLWVYDIPAKNKRMLLPLSRLKDAATKVPEPAVFDWTNRHVGEQPVQWFEKGDRLLVSHAGDLFTVSLAAAEPGQARIDQLTATPVAEIDPKLSPDNRYVSFRRLHDLYVLDLSTRKATPLTSGGSDTVLNAELDWVYPEELELSTAHWWSPDSRRIAYLQLDVHSEPIFPQVSLTAAHAAYEPERFPQPGDPNADARLGVVSVEGGPTTWMNLGEMRDHLLARVAWMPDSSAVTAMRLNRVQNELDLLRADAATGASQTLIHETDPYWINIVGAPIFLKSSPEFLWESERDGFRHLYLYGNDGKLKRQITRGQWAVEAVKTVDEQRRQIYYVSEEDSPLERHLYRIGLNGEDKQRLTVGRGVHGISVSPSGEYFFDSHSSLDTSPQQTLRDRQGGEVLVWHRRDAVFDQSYDLSQPEILTVKAADHSVMYARLIRPKPFEPGKKYPVVVDVYGGPGAQSIRNEFQGINIDQVLAAQGYVVWALDNRGSAGRGHKWESVIFRDLGKHELEDQKVGVEYLKKLAFVDPARIGITGWSYGGYMTLYSLLNAPGLFRAGLAGAPVTDWRAYDSIYTERYMGLPAQNKEAYDRSSPLNRAGLLDSRLLIVHNIEDDNVHFQNSVRMAEALERAGKQFRMIVFPEKTHGVTGPVLKDLNETRLRFFEENLKP